MTVPTMTRARGLLLAAAVLSLAACDDAMPTTIGDPLAARQGRVNVGGYRLQTEVEGHGRPTVVLMAGLDAPLETWARVRPAIAAETRVLAYDRAGVGRSETSPTPRRSADEIVAELDRVLERSGSPRPYVLVAHSIAGYYARVYAARFPQRVAGVVLLDAQHELQAEALREMPDLLELIAADQQYVGAQAEVRSTIESAEQAVAAGPLPRVPVAVVTNLTPDPEAGETDAHREFWYAMHAAWVQQGSEGLHLGSQGGHDVPRADPATAIEAIRWVLQRAR